MTIAKLGMFGIVVSTLVGCATDVSGPCADAAAHLEACGASSVTADQFGESCTEERAQEVLGLACTDIETALAEGGKEDGLFGWKSEGGLCWWDWTCQSDLECRNGGCAPIVEIPGSFIVQVPTPVYGTVPTVAWLGGWELPMELGTLAAGTRIQVVSESEVVTGEDDTRYWSWYSVAVDSVVQQALSPTAPAVNRVWIDSSVLVQQ